MSRNASNKRKQLLARKKMNALKKKKLDYYSDLCVLNVTIKSFKDIYLDFDPTDFSDGGFLELSNWIKDKSDLIQTEGFKNEIIRAYEYFNSQKKPPEWLQAIFDYYAEEYEYDFQTIIDTILKRHFEGWNGEEGGCCCLCWHKDKFGY